MDDPPSPSFLLLCHELSCGKVRPLGDYLSSTPEPFLALDDIGRSLLFHALLVPTSQGVTLAKAFLEHGAPAYGVYAAQSSQHQLLSHPLCALASSAHGKDNKTILVQALLSRGSLDHPNSRLSRHEVMEHLRRYHPDFHDLLVALDKVLSLRSRLLDGVAPGHMTSPRPAL